MSGCLLDPLFIRNGFFDLISCLGSKSLLDLGLYMIQKKVSWFLFMYLVVEIITSIIEVFFDSIAFF